jgi:hypothetical protein
MLDGLFNNAVVLCEAEADCRFYSAVLDNLPKSKNRYSNSNLLFVPVSGKHRIRKASAAYKKLGVPVRAIVDLDLLNDERLFRETFESLGGEWSRVTSYYNIIKTFIATLPGSLDGNLVKSKLKRIVTTLPDTPLDRSHVKSINDITRGFLTSWGRLKKLGARTFTSPAEQVAYNSLIEEARKIGLFLVEKGELEGFVVKSDTKALRGEKWLAKVFEKNYHVNSAHGNAGEFMKKVVIKQL